MAREQLDMVYYGNDCVTRYWVYNEKLGCIAGGHVDSANDKLAKELKVKTATEKAKLKAV